MPEPNMTKVQDSLSAFDQATQDSGNSTIDALKSAVTSLRNIIETQMAHGGYSQRLVVKDQLTSIASDLDSLITELDAAYTLLEDGINGVA